MSEDTKENITKIETHREEHESADGEILQTETITKTEVETREDQDETTSPRKKWMQCWMRSVPRTGKR